MSLRGCMRGGREMARCLPQAWPRSFRAHPGPFRLPDRHPIDRRSVIAFNKRKKSEGGGRRPNPEKLDPAKLSNPQVVEWVQHVARLRKQGVSLQSKNWATQAFLSLARLIPDRLKVYLPVTLREVDFLISEALVADRKAEAAAALGRVCHAHWRIRRDILLFPARRANVMRLLHEAADEEVTFANPNACALLAAAQLRLTLCCRPYWEKLGQHLEGGASLSPSAAFHILHAFAGLNIGSVDGRPCTTPARSHRLWRKLFESASAGGYDSLVSGHFVELAIAMAAQRKLPPPPTRDPTFRLMSQGAEDMSGMQLAKTLWALKELHAATGAMLPRDTLAALVSRVAVVAHELSVADVATIAEALGALHLPLEGESVAPFSSAVAFHAGVMTPPELEGTISGMAEAAVPSEPYLLEFGDKLLESVNRSQIVATLNPARAAEIAWGVACLRLQGAPDHLGCMRKMILRLQVVITGVRVERHLTRRMSRKAKLKARRKAKRRVKLGLPTEDGPKPPPNYYHRDVFAKVHRTLLVDDSSGREAGFMEKTSALREKVKPAAQLAAALVAAAPMTEDVHLMKAYLCDLLARHATQPCNCQTNALVGDGTVAVDILLSHGDSSVVVVMDRGQDSIAAFQGGRRWRCGGALMNDAVLHKWGFKVVRMSPLDEEVGRPSPALERRLLTTLMSAGLPVLDSAEADEQGAFEGVGSRVPEGQTADDRGAGVRTARAELPQPRSQELSPSL